jgi:hypothetical protein
VSGTKCYPCLRLVSSSGCVPWPTQMNRKKNTDPISSHSYSLARLQINTAPSFPCRLEENHQGGHEPAQICRPCYDHLQERVDLMEAALHIDLKEAAKIVYDAVWSDPSDPSKTYQNAAQALLTELRKRLRHHAIHEVCGGHGPEAAMSARFS